MRAIAHGCVLVASDPRVGLLAPNGTHPPVPAASKTVEFIAGGIFLVIVLMVTLCGPEDFGVFDRRNNLGFQDTGLFELGLGFLGNPDLLTFEA